MMRALGLPQDPTRALRVLCLGAHCDDIEIGCGATLLRLCEERPETRFEWTIFASTEERAREARGSAQDFLEGASEARITVESFRESYFPWVGAEIKDRFEGLKASPAPDLVLTHRSEDAHQDHRLVSELTWNSFRDHLILEYEIPKYDGDLGRPNCYVPCSRAQAERKVELLLRHYRSQAKRSWFTAETFLALLRLRGIECNAPEGYAEAFHARKLVL